MSSLMIRRIAFERKTASGGEAAAFGFVGRRDVAVRVLGAGF
jgi:tRNA U54 and U55 pseudouridine synthase Pus10